RGEGLPVPGVVQIVNAHTAHRPTRAAAEEAAAASTGRRAPQYTSRWPVRPHPRAQCMIPQAHSDGDCQHEERIIPTHITGPAGKPLRVRDTVHLWDHQPEPGPAEGS